MKKPKRIVIVDNNPASTADFHALLETQPDLVIAATVTCASCSFAAVTQQHPDLVLIELTISDHRLLELVRDLTVLHAGLKFLIVTNQDQELEAAQVLRAGAHGCVKVGSSSATKLEAVRQVLAGSHPFTPPPVPRQAAGAAPFACAA